MRSNFRLLTGFSSFLSTALNRGNEARVYGQKSSHCFSKMSLGNPDRPGKLYLPFGKGKHAAVAAEDIASVIVGILDNPEPHVGQHYVVTGPKDMTIGEMAEVLTTEIGKPVEYIDLPIAEWRKRLVEKAGVPEFLATHLAAVAQDHQDGVFSAETDVVERIGGRPPLSFALFVRNHIAEFNGNTHSSGRRIAHG